MYFWKFKQLCLLLIVVNWDSSSFSCISRTLLLIFRSNLMLLFPTWRLHTSFFGLLAFLPAIGSTVSAPWLSARWHLNFSLAIWRLCPGLLWFGVIYGFCWVGGRIGQLFGFFPYQPSDWGIVGTFHSCPFRDPQSYRTSSSIAQWHISEYFLTFPVFSDNSLTGSQNSSPEVGGRRLSAPRHEFCCCFSGPFRVTIRVDYWPSCRLQGQGG